MTLIKEKIREAVFISSTWQTLFFSVYCLIHKITLTVCPSHTMHLVCPQSPSPHSKYIVGDVQMATNHYNIIKTKVLDTSFAFFLVL